MKKILLMIFIISLSLCACVSIGIFLFGKFGETEWKIIGTTFVIGVFSITSLSSATLVERKRYKIFAWLGIFSAICAFVLAIYGIWGTVSNESFFKTMITLIVLALSMSHLSLMLFIDNKHPWV